MDVVTVPHELQLGLNVLDDMRQKVGLENICFVVIFHQELDQIDVIGQCVAPLYNFLQLLLIKCLVFFVSFLFLLLLLH